jgi:hypothetical protein
VEVPVEGQPGEEDPSEKGNRVAYPFLVIVPEVDVCRAGYWEFLKSSHCYFSCIYF